MTTEKFSFDKDAIIGLTKNKVVRVVFFAGCTVLAFYIFGKLMKLSAGVVSEFKELREAIKK